jgi:hypothetical protein
MPIPHHSSAVAGRRGETLGNLAIHALISSRRRFPAAFSASEDGGRSGSGRPAVLALLYVHLR